MTLRDRIQVITDALNWMMEIPTPRAPRPSAWSDVGYAEFWRDKRSRVAGALDDIRLELCREEHLTTAEPDAKASESSEAERETTGK